MNKMNHKTKALRFQRSARPNIQIKDLNVLVPIEVSARHIHLSEKDLEALFGKGYQLKKIKQLTQPCDFASEEVLGVRVGENVISKIRVVGPVRTATQLELSITDAVKLGIEPPLRLSGDLKDSPGAIIMGPQGEVELKEGVIIAQRHIHLNPAQAKKIGLEDGSIVSVEVKGDRAVVFHNVKVRVKDGYEACLHLDTDEGNAAGVFKKGEGTII